MSEVINAIEKISDGFDDYKKVSEKKLDQLTDRLEQIEAMSDRPGKAGGAGDFGPEQREYKGVFLDWIRKPGDGRCRSRLDDAQHELGKKDVSIGSNPAGGYALPEEIARQIEKRERQLNPFRELVRVDRCSTNDYKALVSMGDGTAGWVSETGTRTATDSPTLRERAPTFGEQYAYPTTTQWALDDVFFNVQEWLVNEVADEWASQEATAIISGNGSDKPTGILASNPTSTDDHGSPMRNANVIEYVPLPAAASSPFTTTAPTVDQLIDLIGTVKERYLADASGVAFVMHRLTAARLRKQKTTDGQYLWQDSLQAGQPATLLGYKVLTCDAMPTVAANAFPVLFGNFKRGYLLVDRVGMRILPNPYSVPGKVSYYCSRRIGGCVLSNDAIKAAKISLS